MIESIYIRNFGIIDEAEFKLGSGFNVITGETGTGKSMIVNAMGLVFGRRLGNTKFLNSTQKTVIEITVSMDENIVGGLLDEYDIDRQFPIIIRREIAVNGRSRAFVNDTPAPNVVLKELASLFVDVSEQHETLSLSQRATKFSLVDGYSENQKQLRDYQSIYKDITNLGILIENKEIQLQKLQSEQDYFRFQLNELEELNYSVGEEQGLKEELELLENAEIIKQSLFAAYQKIDKEEYGLGAISSEAIQALKVAAAHHKKASELFERLSEISFEITEIGSSLETEFEQIEYNPERLSEVESRLSFIYKLMSKHGVDTAEELIEIREDYRFKLTSFDDLSHEIKQLKDQYKALSQDFKKTSEALTNSRIKSIPKIEKDIKSRLGLLAMPTADFKVEMTPSQQPHILGGDEIDLLFSANQGVVAQPISQVASGGELSRLMLAIKSLLGMKKQMPTLIFDEIDSGISGETATKVGEMMRDLSKHVQLIVISHLPQIAAKAEYHLIVEKTMDGKRTSTVIRKLDQAERIKAIATMVSGDKNSANAELTAKEMMML